MRLNASANHGAHGGVNALRLHEHPGAAARYLVLQLLQRVRRLHMLTLQQIARTLGGEVSTDEVLAPGPGHSPEDRSLSIKLDASAPDGFLVHSFAGDHPIRCKDYVREKLGLPAWSGGTRGSTHGKSIVWTYNYTDEAGELLFQVVRFLPKTFRQRQPDGKGGWVWSLKGARRVLYCLPQVKEAVASRRMVFIAEGEKAADALMKLGASATCSPGGAGKWRKDYSQHLVGADVVILPDNDEAGEHHCEAVAKSLTSIAARVLVLRLPGLPAKGDVYDWVQEGGTAEQLGQLVEKNSIDWTANSEPSGSMLICRRASELEPEQVEWLWTRRIARGKHTCIAGEPGTGKSQLSIAIAATISTGGDGHAVRDAHHGAASSSSARRMERGILSFRA